MSHRTTFARSIAQTVRRWLPRAASVAGAAAAAGDPTPLLDLEAGRLRHDHTAGTE